MPLARRQWGVGWRRSDADRERAADVVRLRRVADRLDARIAAFSDGGRPAETERDRVRRRLALVAALEVADNAQSPVITATDPWDYRRDRHREGAAWERAWMEEILGEDGRGRRALVTSCGMAAVTTVLAFVERETGAGPIVVDANVYHETRHLILTGSLRARVEVVASEAVSRRARELDASVVFVDAVSNTRDVRVADIDELVRMASPPGGPHPLIVVDTSVCSMSSAMVRAALLAGPSRLVLVESLTKHAQLGLDRVAAGIIVAPDAEARRLDELREHLGTNISDVACMLLPRPDRVALEQRLARIARNASLIAAAMADAGLDVRHPSVSSHPDHARWRRLAPSCGVLTLPAAPIEEWLSYARDAGVELDHGAGFGFDVTRVYRTTRTVAEATEFVRVAPGTEPIDVARQVAGVVSERSTRPV
jgi:cystathionine beta-lyase/cystathionine gamma-synthase